MLCPHHSMSQRCCRPPGQRWGVLCPPASGETIRAVRAEGASTLCEDFSFDVLFTLEARNWMDSKLRAAFSPRGRPGGNRTVSNTMLVYFTSGGCHYLRGEEKNQRPALHRISVIFPSFSVISEQLSWEKF